MDECPARLRGRPHDFDPLKEVCRACGMKREASENGGKTINGWIEDEIARRWPRYHVYPRPIQQAIHEFGPLVDGTTGDTGAFQEALDKVYGRCKVASES